ncbi:MAG: ROK family protein [Verrucomicrobiia bacterium]
MASSKKYWVGFDLGGTKLMAGVFDSKLRLLHAERAKMRGVKGAKAGIVRMVELIRQVMADAGVRSPRELRGIGLGVPGPLDLNRGVILDAPNLGWKNVNLKKAMREAFGCPAVVANDVDAGTYGEYRFGSGRGARCVLGVFPGTGIGGACIYEGKLLRGRVGSCMEIGHVQVQPNGRLCGCGRRGCLETVASRLAITSEAATASYRGQAPHLRELAGTDMAAMRSRALREAIEEGDDCIAKILEEAARQLGGAIASVVNLLAPDVVVLGGGLVEAMPKLFLKGVREAIARESMGAISQHVTVAAARLGDNATIMGAAALAAEEDGR